jgi:elongation factor Ts
VRTISGDKFEIYLHKTSKDLPPQVGVVLAYTGDDAETARSIAQHISFANPTYLARGRPGTRSRRSARSSRRSPQRGQAGGRPAEDRRGRVNAFFKQVALLDQDYAKDNKLSVAKVAGDAGSRSPTSPASRSARKSRRGPHSPDADPFPCPTRTDGAAIPATTRNPRDR